MTSCGCECEPNMVATCPSSKAVPAQESQRGFHTQSGSEGHHSYYIHFMYFYNTRKCKFQGTKARHTSCRQRPRACILTCQTDALLAAVRAGKLGLAGESTLRVFRRREVVAVPAMTKSMLFSSRNSTRPCFASSCKASKATW